MSLPPRDRAPSTDAAVAPDVTPLSDDGLLRAMARGSIDAVAQLYDRYAALSYSLAVRMLGDAALAENVVEEAFLSIWHDARATRRVPTCAPVLVCSTVRERALQRLGRRSPPHRAGLAVISPRAAATPCWGPSDSAVLASRARHALARLTPEQRAIVEDAVFSGRSCSETAEEVGVAPDAAATELRIALGLLHDELADASGAAATTPPEAVARGDRTFKQRRLVHRLKARSRSARRQAGPGDLT